MTKRIGEIWKPSIQFPRHPLALTIGTGSILRRSARLRNTTQANEVNATSVTGEVNSSPADEILLLVQHQEEIYRLKVALSPQHPHHAPSMLWRH